MQFLVKQYDIIHYYNIITFLFTKVPTPNDEKIHFIT